MIDYYSVSYNGGICHDYGCNFESAPLNKSPVAFFMYEYMLLSKII